MNDRRNRPVNRFGCKPVGDVCVEHDQPLECRHGCLYVNVHRCIDKKQTWYTLYTVQRAHKNDSLYGKIHGSTDGSITACGIDVDHNWFIINNTFDDEITCQKCIDNISSKLYHELSHE